MLFALQAFGQTFDPGDMAFIGLLILLEGVLSIDNALVLGLLAKRLPKHQQGRALTYGLVGAFAFRLIAIATASYLVTWDIAKLLGGGYLVYIAVRHLFFESKEQVEAKIVVGEEGRPEMRDSETGAPLTNEQEQLEVDERLPVATSRTGPSFWGTVMVIELTDIAFAVDSIMAAIGLVGPKPDPAAAVHPKLWVIVAGGMLGVLLMRVAAVIFIKLLQRFPRFEVSAYLLVIVIGGKLLADWAFNSGEHGEHVALNFHSPTAPAFWIFWALMLICFVIGFLPEKKKKADGHIPR